MSPKTCRYCGASLNLARHKKREFCSKNCFDTWQRGKPNLKLTITKIDKTCAVCGKHFQVTPAHDYRKYCSMICYGSSKIGKHFNIRDRNGQWKGGVSLLHDSERRTSQYETWRIAVFKRDNYTCQDCNTRGGCLHAHHLYPFAQFPHLRHVLSNGRTLCEKCHNKTKQHEYEYLKQLGLDAHQPPLFW